MSKKRNIPPLTAAALTAALLAGCAGDSTSDFTPEPATDDTEIKVNANVWQVMEGTRATTFNTAADLQSEGFKCSLYEENTTTIYDGVNNIPVNWSSSAWAFSDGTHKWPDNDGVLDFFAYSPQTVPAYITGPTYAVAGTPAPYFTCDMTKTVDKEFVWALTTGRNRQNSASGVMMTFRHPFARIYFQLSSESGTHVTINSITISGEDFYKTGTCTFDGTNSSWSIPGGASALGSLATNTPYLVIPNDYGSSKTITVDATWDEWSNVSTTVTSSALSINWQPGYSYTYTLTLSPTALKVDTDKYTEQW